MQVQTTDVCVHKLLADQGDDALEVLASDFLTPFFQEPFEGGSLRECSVLEVLSSPGEPSSPLTRTLPLIQTPFRKPWPSPSQGRPTSCRSGMSSSRSGYLPSKQIKNIRIAITTPPWEGRMHRLIKDKRVGHNHNIAAGT